MPRKLIDPVSNEEVEVPDQSELEALSARAKEAEVAAAKLKEQEDLLKDPEFGNFKAMREKVRAAEKKAEEAVKHAEEMKRIMSNTADKPINDPAAQVPPVAAEASVNTIRGVLAEERINQRLGKYADANQREVIKHYFDRLCAPDERLDEAKVEKRMAEAERLAIPEGRPSRVSSATGSGAIYGQPPTVHDEGSEQERLERGKELAQQFGYRFNSDKFRK